MLMNVYVVWVVDGPTMTTLLQFDDTPAQRQRMQQWSVKDYVEQAAYAEVVDLEGCTYEVVAIFESNDLRFIY